MMVLGSFEFPMNQRLIEEPWSHFSFDVGLAFPAQDSRSLHFLGCSETTEPSGSGSTAVVCLPAPYLRVRRGGVSSDIYYSNSPHGLGLASLSCFPSWAVRVLVAPVQGSPVQSMPVIEVLSATKVRVQLSAGGAASMGGALVVASACTRTFSSAHMLASCLRAFCANPFPGFEFMQRLNFEYTPARMELALTVAPRARSHTARPDALVLDVREDNLLSALAFNVPQSDRFVLPEHMLSEGFPTQSTRPRQGAPRAGLFSQTTQVQIPPGNYEWSHLQKITEMHINNKAFLELPPGGQPIVVFIWGTAGAYKVAVAEDEMRAFFHPAAVARYLSEQFSRGAGTHPGAARLKWVYEQDRYICRPTVPGTVFRVQWPSDDAQMLPFRLRVNDAEIFSTELRGEPLNFVPCPTIVTLPGTYHATLQVPTAKKYAFAARPKLVPGGATRLCNIQVEDVPLSGTQVGIALGSLPLEVLVLVYEPPYSPKSALFGVVTSNSTDASYTYITLLTDSDVVQITLAWRVDVVPLQGGAFNLYFPRAHVQCWSRLAEIYGFPGGATMWVEPMLIAPWQWNLEQPSYVLLDLGLQHVSATITHRCGNSVLSQFFGKIVLYPPFKEIRMTPIQALGTGVSVVSSLHLRILNPWHQLYHLHGRNWSLTVILASGTRAARTDCP